MITYRFFFEGPTYRFGNNYRLPVFLSAQFWNLEQIASDMFWLFFFTDCGTHGVGAETQAGLGSVRSAPGINIVLDVWPCVFGARTRTNYSAELCAIVVGPCLLDNLRTFQQHVGHQLLRQPRCRRGHVSGSNLALLFFHLAQSFLTELLVMLHLSRRMPGFLTRKSVVQVGPARTTRTSTGQPFLTTCGSQVRDESCCASFVVPSFFCTAVLSHFAWSSPSLGGNLSATRTTLYCAQWLVDPGEG